MTDNRLGLHLDVNGQRFWFDGSLEDLRERLRPDFDVNVNYSDTLATWATVYRTHTRRRGRMAKRERTDGR